MNYQIDKLGAKHSLDMLVHLAIKWLPTSLQVGLQNSEITFPAGGWVGCLGWFRWMDELDDNHLWL